MSLAGFGTLTRAAVKRTPAEVIALAVLDLEPDWAFLRPAWAWVCRQERINRFAGPLVAMINRQATKDIQDEEDARVFAILDVLDGQIKGASQRS